MSHQPYGKGFGFIKRSDSKYYQFTKIEAEEYSDDFFSLDFSVFETIDRNCKHEKAQKIWLSCLKTATVITRFSIILRLYKIHIFQFFRHVKKLKECFCQFLCSNTKELCYQLITMENRHPKISITKNAFEAEIGTKTEILLKKQITLSK